MGTVFESLRSSKAAPFEKILLRWRTVRTLTDLTTRKLKPNLLIQRESSALSHEKI